MDSNALRSQIPDAEAFGALSPCAQRRELVALLDKLLSGCRLSGRQPDDWERLHLKRALQRLDLAEFREGLESVATALTAAAERPALDAQESRAAANIDLCALLHDFHVVASYPRRPVEEPASAADVPARPSWYAAYGGHSRCLHERS